MPLLVRRHLNKRNAPLCNISRRSYGLATLRSLFRLLLLVSLMHGGFVVTQTQQQYEDIIVEFSSRECPNKDDWEFSSIEIHGNKVSASKGGQRLINLTPGDHVVSGLREPDYPNAKLVAVRVKLGNKLIKEYPVDASGSVTITMDASLFNAAGARAQIIPVSENDCGDKPTTKKEKLVDKKAYVILRSLECEKDNYDDYSINIDGRIIKPNTLEGAYDVPINPGESEISISVPGYSGAKIKDVSILDPNRKRDSSFLAGDSGIVKITLKESLWPEASSQPFIILHLVGDCSPSYDPPAQGPFGQPRIKVATVTGKVQVFKDDNPNYEARVEAGSMMEDQQVIYTGPGARVELVASDKRLFILGEKTVAKISIKTLEGLNIENIEEIKNITNVKWELNINARTGSIQTSHVGHPKGNKPYELKMLTPTAAVTEKQTVYSVSYDESDKVTTVGVELGQVTVTPTNTSLNPFTLDAHQMVDVFTDRVSAITPFLAANDPKGLNLRNDSDIRSLLKNNLLLVGIAALLGLLFLLFVVYFIYRLLKRTPKQPAYVPASVNAGAMPAGKGPVRNAAVGRRCPNPNCGRMVRAGKRFCTACGTPLS